MDKPSMKKHLVITARHRNQGIVYFYADEILAAQAADFGNLVKLVHKHDYWEFQIDARYDFDEVVAWLESLA